MAFTRFGVRINCLLRLVDRSCLVLHLWRWVKGCGMAFGNSRCLRKSDIFYGELSERRCLPSLIRSSGKWWLKVFVSSVVTQMKIASMLYGYVIQLSPFGCLISVFPFCVQRSFPHLKMFFAFYVGKLLKLKKVKLVNTVKTEHSRHSRKEKRLKGLTRVKERSK